jgi:hypothetical protein
MNTQMEAVRRLLWSAFKALTANLHDDDLGSLLLMLGEEGSSVQEMTDRLCEEAARQTA